MRDHQEGLLRLRRGLERGREAGWRDQRIQEGRPRALASPLNSQLGKVQLTA